MTSLVSNFTLIIVAFIAIIPSLLGLYYSHKNNKDIHEIHLSINSRMDELLKSSGDARQAQGRELGRKEKK